MSTITHPTNPTYDFSGKTVVVTGSARGIGRQIGERFYQAGANVAFCSISPKGKEELMQEVAGDDRSRIMACAVDVSRPDQIDSFFSAVVEKFGAFDVLVNNAGIYQKQDVLDVTEADWDRMMDTDVKSVFFASQWFLRYHQAAGTGGSIVNTASVGGIVVNPTCVLYGVAKASVSSLTKHLSAAAGPLGVRVNAVGPGSIPTDLNAALYADPSVEEALKAKLPLGRRGTPNEIAECVLFLASDAASYVTGHTLYAEGGWLAS